MSNSSSIPVLSDVLFYTPDDSYNYQTDNRPIYQLDTNLRHIATSLVGIGYGEHASIAGGLLTPGRAVELLANGTIRYPLAQTAQLANAGNKPVLGLVIGSTEAGLNRVVWATDHLDLESVGLDGILANPASGLLLVADCSDDVILSGKISAVTTPSASQVILGNVKVYPYVTVSSFSTLSTTTAALTATSKVNHNNLYGFTRLRNLLAVIDLGQTPIQYTKETFYQSDLSTINPMSAMLSADKASIKIDSKIPSYDTKLAGKIIKERYYTFKTSSGDSDKVSDSTWSNIAYPLNLGVSSTATYENYELTPVAISTSLSSTDYSTTASLDTFKNFTIEKYYQYLKTSYTNTTLYGKLAVTATVFNPDGVANEGGEYGRIIIWDFYEYDSATGAERVKHRIVSTGTSANTLFTNTSIFPAVLVNLK